MNQMAAQSPLPTSSRGWFWPPLVLWLLLPPLQLAAARAFNLGMDMACVAVFICSLMACFWQAHVHSLRERTLEADDEAREAALPAQQRADAWPPLLALKNALVLLVVATPAAYGYAYWAAHQGALPEFAAIAAPVKAQVEARARAGYRPGNWEQD